MALQLKELMLQDIREEFNRLLAWHLFRTFGDNRWINLDRIYGWDLADRAEAMIRSDYAPSDAG